MSDDESGGVINIRSRIQKFSGLHPVDNNGNMTNAKPNPTPRRRHRTEEVAEVNKQRTVVSRSSSSPVSQKKPQIPSKPPLICKSPVPAGSLSPSPSPRPISGNPPPKSPKPPAKPRPDIKNNKVETSENVGFHNNRCVSPNINKINNNNNNNNNNIDCIKPRPPLKPAINKQTDKPVTTQSKNIDSNTKQLSWKKMAGPPKTPVPAGPSMNVPVTSEPLTDINPPKPPRGKERQSRLTYENSDIEPIIIKRSAEPDSQRRDTLDGQLILGPTKKPLSPICKS